MLTIADKTFHSRLFLGTGKFASSQLMAEAVRASGSELVTLALKRLELDRPESDSLLSPLLSEGLSLLPNTSGARTAREAILAAELSREALQTNWLKLEIHPHPRYLMPDPIETLEAATELVRRGFVVLPYVQADPVGMAEAFRLGVEAGRKAYEARLAPQRSFAQASSPLTAFLS